MSDKKIGTTRPMNGEHRQQITKPARIIRSDGVVVEAATPNKPVKPNKPMKK